MNEFPIYLLSTEGSPRRQRAIDEVVRVFGREPAVIDGWNARGDKELPMDQVLNNSLPRLFPRMKSCCESLTELSQIACSSGHLMIWIRFLALNVPYCMVVEDDVKFLKDKPSFEYIAKAYMENAYGGIHWVQFQADGEPHKRECPLTGDENDHLGFYRADYSSWGTVCYFIHKRGAITLLDKCIPIYDHIDMMMRANAKNMVVYQAAESWAIEDEENCPSLING